MIVYHGSYTSIPKPDLSFSKENTDFGKGFYTTAVKEQAEKWTMRFKRKNGSGVVSVYEFDESTARETGRIIKFKGYTAEWLDYISQARRGNAEKNVDIVIGCVANDDVFNTLRAYWAGYMNKGRALKRLTYTKPNIQICFRSQTAVDLYLKYVEEIII